MTTNTLEERQRYIHEIKASFQNPRESQQYTDFDLPVETTVKKSFFKIKLFISVAVFAGFIYLDQNQISIQGYSVNDVYNELEKTVSLENIIQTIENML